MTPPIDRITAQIVQERGWKLGSNLENEVSRVLSGVFRLGEVLQQHRIGRWKVDYAWPDVKVALEVDGWYHRSPEGAARDAMRDADIRAQGWIVLRIDDRGGRDAMLDQLVRVCEVVHALRGRR